MTIHNQPPRLYLASRSPRRRELLAQIGVAFDTLFFRSGARADAEVDETPLPGEAPLDYVQRVAREKASALAHTTPGAVLCADTSVVAGRRILGKPADENEAAAFLRLLSGRRHLVLTAVALSHAGRIHERLVETVIRFRPLTDAEREQMLREYQQQQAATEAQMHPEHEEAEGGEVSGRVAGFDETDPTTWGNPSRNDPCPCGSGRKFKHCHGALT
mgnify:CR=1 FL=1